MGLLPILRTEGEVGMTDIKETIQGLYSIKTYLASKAIEEHGPARESLIDIQKVVDSAVNLLEGQEASWIRAPYKKARFCSRCYADEPYKFADEDANVYDYCPNCGARMINRR